MDNLYLIDDNSDTSYTPKIDHNSPLPTIHSQNNMENDTLNNDKHAEDSNNQRKFGSVAEDSDSLNQEDFEQI